MSTDRAQGPRGTPPDTMFRMLTGYWPAQAVYVVAKLGVADHLAAGPMSGQDLAAATGADAPTLYRVLRALASVGIFTEATLGTFALTPLADLLRSGTPDSMRPLAIMYGEEQYRAWGDLLHSVTTGGVAFEHRYGMPVFTYYAQHPEADRTFNEAMVSLSNQAAGAVADAYDFAPFGTIADVGGGHGPYLAAILRRNPRARGILFDLPHVVAGAAGLLTAAGVADRCATVGGDFFQELPAGADAYLLVQALHNWDDERCVAILRQCRRAIPDHGKLLLVELVVPSGEEPSVAKWVDLHMLVMASGRERTTAEYDALLLAAGFRLTRVVPTSGGLSVVEAVPV